MCMFAATLATGMRPWMRQASGALSISGALQDGWAQKGQVRRAQGRKKRTGALVVRPTYAVGMGSRREPWRKRLSESRPREPSSRLSAAKALGNEV